MIQLAFGLGVDKSAQSWGMDILRTLFAAIDTIVYYVLTVIYEILFNIANSTIVSSDTIKSFYGRVQLIIGVFMIFKLAISLLQAVINPDILTDQKNGMGKIITRIITMLIMLTSIIPLNIPNATPGSYNAYLNQNGLLFGTLYSLQARILNTGVIQNLVLGYSTPTGEKTEPSSGTDYEDSGNSMAKFLLTVFVRVNLVDINAGVTEDNYRVAENSLDNDYEGAYDTYENGTVTDILSNINATDGKYYAFAYFPIASTICGAIIIVIMCAFCIDVAARAIKLAILRLIAPIPIISYIDPKSAEKGSFATWVKMLMSTFLNLFIILAVVHFVIFLVEQLLPGENEALAISFSDNIMVNLLTIVFIIIGVFFFAKQAPKFIMDALGIKGGGLGAGLSGLLGATGALMGGGGLAGAMSGFMGAANDASNAAAQGKQAPPAIATQRANMAKMITGDDKNDGSMAYRMQKAFHDKAGASALNRLYGVNQNSLKRKKEDMYNLQDQAEMAKNTYEDFKRGNLSSNEMNGLANMIRSKAISEGLNPDRYTTVDSNGNVALTDEGRQYTSKYLEESYLQAQSAAGKAKADFEKMQKIGDRANISMTPEQEHMTSMRERFTDSTLYRAYRAGRDERNDGGSAGDILRAAGSSVRESASNNRVASQTIRQRTTGERDVNGNYKGNKF